MAFNGRFIVNLADFASRSTAEANELLSISGMSAEELCRDDCRVSNEVYTSVIEKALEISKDPYFGLHAGENLNLSAAGLIAQITQSASSIKEALEYCIQFANLGCSVLPMSMEEHKDHYKILFSPDPLWVRESQLSYRHTSDGVITFSIREIDSLSRNKFKAIAVHLPWSKQEVQEYERIFATDVFFEQKELAILIRKEDMETQIMSADYDLLRVLVRHAQEKSSRFNAEEDYINKVKKSVLNLIKPDFPNIEHVAAHMNVSVRTLQRRLNESNVTYKNLITEMKMEMASSYLDQEDLSISEVAYLLNYSDPSSFIRAFKKQFGLSPNEFRRKNEGIVN